MREAVTNKDIQVERLFVTCLQKALDEHAPEQLEVFGKWFDLSSRQTRFHVAPVIGAVGYLRKNASIYEKVVEAAGIGASERAYADMSQIERRLLKSLPRFGKERFLKHLLHSGLRSIHKDALLSVQKDNGKFIITVDNSIFCLTPADDGGGHRCQFYAALFAGLLQKTDIPCSSVREVSCRGQGEEACRFEVDEPSGS